MQPDMAEIDGLMDALDVIEKEPDAIGRVIVVGLDGLGVDEADFGIGAGEQRDQPPRHGDGQSAFVRSAKRTA